jgi:cell division septation protein DedD
MERVFFEKIEDNSSITANQQRLILEMTDQTIQRSIDDDRSIPSDHHTSSDTRDDPSILGCSDTSTEPSPLAPNPSPPAGSSKMQQETTIKEKVVAPKEEKSGAKSTKVKKPKAGTKYTFFVGPGNNGELVRTTLERRPWWELGKEDDPELNLKWLQVCRHSLNS